jgi:CHAD domain-containing protein
MLNTIRRAAGAARDLDVLTMRLTAAYGDELGPILDEIATRRAKAQASIHSAYEAAMKEGALQQLMFETLERVGPRRRRDKKRKRAVFAKWAQRQLNSTAEEFFAAQPADSRDYLALHEFRVCGKGLRYVMELLAGAFADDFRKEAYPRVEELQERLGTINDHYTAANELGEWEQLAVSETDAELLARLARQEREAMETEVAEFDAWWTVERATDLRSALVGQYSSENSHEPSENGAVTTRRKSSAP